MQKSAGLFPEWSHSTHPMVWYALGRNRHKQPNYANGVIIALFIILIMLLSALHGDRENYPDHMMFYHVLAVPLIMIQWFLHMLMFQRGDILIWNESEHGHWERLRITPSGVWLSIRGYWVAILRRVGGLLLLLVFGRLLLVINALEFLNSFYGEYFEHLLFSVIPEVSLFVGVLALAAWFAALVILPVIIVAFYAAVVIAISALKYIILRWIFRALFLLLNLEIVWSAHNSWGVAELDLMELETLWVYTPYSIFGGFALLVLFALMAWGVAGLLRFSAWAVQKG